MLPVTTGRPWNPHPTHLLLLLLLGMMAQVSAAGSRFHCPSAYGMFPHTSDCSRYFVCSMWTVFVMSCHPGLRYNHDKLTCDWPNQVVCGRRAAQDATRPTETVGDTDSYITVGGGEKSAGGDTDSYVTGNTDSYVTEGGGEQDNWEQEEIDGEEFRPVVLKPGDPGSGSTREPEEEKRLTGERAVHIDEEGSGGNPL